MQSDDARNTDHRIAVEQTALLFQRSNLALLGSASVSVLLVAALWKELPVSQTAPWLAYMMGLTGLRAGLIAAYGRSGTKLAHHLRWRRVSVLGSTANAIGWGASAFVLFAPGSVPHQALLFIIIAGMMGSAVVSLAPVKSAVVWFLLCASAPAIVRMVTLDQHIYFALAAVTGVFSLIMMHFATLTDATIAKLMRLRFENADLAEDLRDANQRAQTLNAELRRSRDAALRSARAKSEFAANVSHEIRSPINGILGMSELLLTSQLDRIQRQYAETVHGSGQALLNLVNNILDFSKFESGKLTLETAPTDVYALVEDIAEQFSEPARSKGIEIVCVLPPDDTDTFYVDPGRLRQVLTNLCSNALKFTEHGQVVLKLSKPRPRQDLEILRFEIIDTGVGIPSSAQARIFHSFTQTDGSTSRRYGGTGLGLAIVKQLTELMGGEIGVSSEQGQGSVFTFDLELEPVRPASGSAMRAHNLAALNVLVVDENPVVAMAIAQQLGVWGVRTASASSSIAARRKFLAAERSATPVDTMIVDPHQSTWSGPRGVSSVYADTATPPPRVIMMSSLASEIERVEHGSFEAAAFVSKPIRRDRLLGALRSLGNDAAMERHVANIPTASAPASPPLTIGAVLVAEDNPINQNLVRSMLGHMGVEFRLVNDGREAVKAFEGRDYDVILMDIQMPNMDGYDATIAIRDRERRLARGRPTPIVAFTANAMAGDRERCLEIGMNDYLSKPFTMAALRRILEKWASSPAPAIVHGATTSHEPAGPDNRSETCEKKGDVIDIAAATRR